MGKNIESNERKGVLLDPVRTMKRAIRYASRDASRPILTAVHLDECGDAVATDSYKLSAEHNVWDGPSIDVPFELAEWMAKRKVANNERATVSAGFGKVVAEMGNGERYECQAVDNPKGHGYPNYKQLFPSEYHAVAYATPKQLDAVLKEHARLKHSVSVTVFDRDFELAGVLCDDERPSMRIEKACDGGDMRIGFDAKNLLASLKAFDAKEAVEIRMENPLKPAVLVQGAIEVLLMPTRIGGVVKPDKKEEAVEGKTEEKEESMEDDGRTAGGNITVECMGRSFYASHPAGTRIKEGGGQVEFIVGKTYGFREKGRDYVLGCLGYDTYRGERKILFCVFRKGEWQGYLRTVAWSKLKTIANHPIDGEKPKEEAPKAEKPKAPAKKKPAAKPKAAKPKPEPKHEDAAVVVSLDYMRAWCSEREDVLATQKREGCCIWVEGITKPYQAELKELGFRWGKSRKAWYFDTKRATA